MISEEAFGFVLFGFVLNYLSALKPFKRPPDSPN